MVVVVGVRVAADALVRAIMNISHLSPEDLPMRLIAPPVRIIGNWSEFLKEYKDGHLIDQYENLKDEQLRQASMDWLVPGFERAVANAVLAGACVPELRMHAIRLDLGIRNWFGLARA